MDSQNPIKTSQSPVVHLQNIKDIIDSISQGETSVHLYNSIRKELDSLASAFKQQKPVNVFAKMLWALVKYIFTTETKNLHDDAFPLLKSLVTALENFVIKPDLSDLEKNQIFSTELEKFNTFKKKIVGSRTITGGVAELKTILLSMDWEINHQTMKSFETIIKKLKLQWKTDNIRISFLNIIYSLGNYIFTKKDKAHAETISFMNSVFKNLELIDQTPSMPHGQKKEILGADISRFQKFKKKITQSLQPGISKKKDADFEPDETDSMLQPALSHIKHVGTKVKNTDDFTPLVLLDSDNDDDLTVLKSTKKESAKQSPPPRDVMGDLFSPKDSEMDELLEEIHRVNFNVTDSQQNLPQQREKKASVPPGMQEFTPTKRDVEPIPEIGDRLDEFFDSPLSEDSEDIKQPSSLSGNDDYKELTPSKAEEDEYIKNPFKASEDEVDEETIIPFEDENFEDDDFEPITDDEAEDISEFEDVETIEEPNWNTESLNVLDQIYSSIENMTYPDSEIILKINKDIVYLEQIWANDPENKIITQILHAFNGLIEKMMENYSAPFTPKKEIKKTGIWSKLKNMFSSGDAKRG